MERPQPVTIMQDTASGNDYYSNNPFDFCIQLVNCRKDIEESRFRSEEHFRNAKRIVALGVLSALVNPVVGAIVIGTAFLEGRQAFKYSHRESTLMDEEFSLVMENSTRVLEGSMNKRTGRYICSN